jgi:hypothetical protein
LKKEWHRQHGDAPLIEAMAHWFLLASGAKQPKGMGRECFIIGSDIATAAINRAIGLWDGHLGKAITPTQLKRRIDEFEKRSTASAGQQAT